MAQEQKFHEDGTPMVPFRYKTEKALYAGLGSALTLQPEVQTSTQESPPQPEITGSEKPK